MTMEVQMSIPQQQMNDDNESCDGNDNNDNDLIHSSSALLESMDRLLNELKEDTPSRKKLPKHCNNNDSSLPTEESTRTDGDDDDNSSCLSDDDSRTAGEFDLSLNMDALVMELQMELGDLIEKEEEEDEDETTTTTDDAAGVSNNKSVKVDDERAAKRIRLLRRVRALMRQFDEYEADGGGENNNNDDMNSSLDSLKMNELVTELRKELGDFVDEEREEEEDEEAAARKNNDDGNKTNNVAVAVAAAGVGSKKDDDEIIIQIPSISAKTSSKYPSSRWIRSAVIYLSIVIAILIIAASVAYSFFGGTKTQSKKILLSELFQIACGDNDDTTDGLIKCDRALFAVDDDHRSIHATTTATKKYNAAFSSTDKAVAEVGNNNHQTPPLLFDIPQSMQITTLSALRDARVRHILRQNPRNPSTGSPLEPENYLAIYLALGIKDATMNNATTNADDDSTVSVNNNNIENSSSTTNSTTISSNNNIEEAQRQQQRRIQKFREAYFKHLPTWEDFYEFHPVARLHHRQRQHEEEEESSSSSSSFSSPFLTDYLTSALYKDCLLGYEGLRGKNLPLIINDDDSSTKTKKKQKKMQQAVVVNFDDVISIEEWITAKLLVETRSFRSSFPLSENDVTDDELDELCKHFIVNDKGRRNFYVEKDLFVSESRERTMRSVIVPLVDSLMDNQEIVWKQQRETGSFVVSLQQQRPQNSTAVAAAVAVATATTTTNIHYDAEADELLYSDSRQYAHYGSVNIIDENENEENDDDNDYERFTAVLLHPLLNEIENNVDDSSRIVDDNKSEKLKLRRYVSMYQQQGSSKSNKECKDIYDNDDDEFRRLKLKAMEVVSKNTKHWIVNYHPSSSSIETSNVLSTCRLLASKPHDYYAQSAKMLRRVINYDEFDGYESFPRSDDAYSNGLEYRSWHILERLANKTKINMIEHLKKIDDEEIDSSNKIKIDTNGMKRYVIQGELKTIDLMLEQAKEWKEIISHRMKQEDITKGWFINGAEDYNIQRKNDILC